MLQRILAVERSPLARNVYSMILSKDGKIEIETMDDQDIDIRGKLYGVDLLIVSQSSIGERKKEFLGIFKEEIKKSGVPCIILAHEGKMADWREFEGAGRVKILERPFFPDKFRETARDLLGGS